MRRVHAVTGLPAFLIAGSLLIQPVVADPLPNAWQITDNTAAASGGNYNTNLPPAEQSAALSDGWRFRVHARLLEDFNDTASMVFYYGVGTNRFSVFLDLDSNNDLTATPFNQPTLTLTTNGTGSAFYHTYEIVYDPATRRAALLFDGIQRTTWDGDDVTAPNGFVAWGSGSSPGQGQMNFHTATFTIETNVAAAYDAGTEGNPAIAPDPRLQGWTATGTSAATTNGVSPDTAPLPAPLVATTLAATNVEPHEATLRGSIELGGLAALAWIEWGATTNYGNASTPQFFKASTNAVSFSVSLAGLPAGVTQRFRCVATNLLGAAYGQDVEVTTPPTFMVTTLANSGAGSLRQAIADALSGDTITFAVTGAIVLTSGQLQISSNLSIVGPGPSLLAVSGNDNSRVFRILSGADVAISGLVIREGHAPDGATGYPGDPGLSGGGIHNAGSLTLSNCVVTGNTAGKGGNGSSPGGYGGPGGHGGGIYNSGTLTLLACTMTNNAAGYGGSGGNGAAGVFGDADGGPGGVGGDGGSGGGIFSSTAFTCIGSGIVDNRPGWGGDGGDGGDAFNASFGNGGNGGWGGSGGYGGGAYTEGPVTLTGCSLRMNSRSGGGSGGSFGAHGALGGSAGSSGSPGSAGVAGGILSWAPATFSGCTLADNEGAINANGPSTLTLDDCSLVNNSGSGAGISVSSQATGFIRRSTFSGNDAGYLGAGILLCFGPVHIENSTFNGNDGGTDAVIENHDTLTLINCTVVGNTSGGIYCFVPAAVTNSIVALNSSYNISGSFVGANYLVTSGNPMLLSLGNYGGPTKTMPPAPGSPAIDAGRDSVTNNLATDQRGYRRRSGSHVDIGAVEVQVASSNNPPMLDQPVFLANGALRLTFTNDPAIAFSVYASTNVDLPANLWIKLGTAAQPSPGQYRYTDSTATNHPRRFYKVVWP